MPLPFPHLVAVHEAVLDDVPDAVVVEQEARGAADGETQHGNDAHLDHLVGARVGELEAAAAHGVHELRQRVLRAGPSRAQEAAPQQRLQRRELLVGER